jgi:hypothetical protein
VRKTFVAPLFLISTMMSAQAAKLTLDDILDATARGVRGRGGNAFVSTDGGYTIQRKTELFC